MDAGTVVSVNVARTARTDEWTKVKSGRSGIDKLPVAGPVLVERLGVPGDTICDVAHHGGPDQALYAYATEDLAFWTAELGRPVSHVGENLTLSGVDCSGAVVGERWRVGGALVRVTGPRIPCRVFAGFLDVPDLVKRFVVAGRPGSYLAVDMPGAVAAGDRVTVVHRPAHGVTVRELFGLETGRRELLGRVLAAREDLGAAGQAWLDDLVEGSRGS